MPVLPPGHPVNIPPTTTVGAGLFGPGIFGTGIDVSALDEDTALRLGAFFGEQLRAAERFGAVRAIRETLAQTAGWVCDEDADTLSNTASAVATLEASDGWLDPEDLESLSCPMCEEVTCDAGCPLSWYRPRVAASQDPS